MDFANLAVSAGVIGSRSKKKIRRHGMEVVQEKPNAEDCYDDEGKLDTCTLSYLKKSQMLS